MSASLPLEILKKYKDITGAKVFFETGTSEGDSVQTAIDAGFELIFSVELDHDTFVRASNRFLDNDCVCIKFGSSTHILGDILPLLEEPILFWLDAHPDCDSGHTPLLREIAAIRDFCARPVAILADDMRLMGIDKWKDVTLLDIQNAAQAVNPVFNIQLEENGHSPKDLFAAFLSEQE